MKKKEAFSTVKKSRPTADQMKVFLDQVPGDALIYLHGFTNGSGGRVEAILETEVPDDE